MPDDFTLAQRVWAASAGGEVERCHAFPHLMRYSVGHHSYGVAALVALCWAEDHAGVLPRAQLVLHALFHDAAECVTGDLPSNIKDMLRPDGGPGVLDHLELSFSQALMPALHGSLAEDLTAEERRYLEACDHLELSMWACDEAERGNSRFWEWAKGYAEASANNPMVPHSVRRLYAEVGAARWFRSQGFFHNVERRMAGIEAGNKHDR